MNDVGVYDRLNPRAPRPLRTMCIMADGEPGFTRSCKLFNFVVCVVVIGVICLAGLAGNVTSFMVLRKHKMETTAVFLLQCMALADSMLLLTTTIIYTFPSLYSFTGWLPVVHEACDVIKIYVWPIAMMTHTTTIWLTVLVTWNRFCACCRPVGSYRKLSVPAVRLQVAGVVLMSVVYNMPRFFEHQPIARLSATDNVTASSNGNGSERHVANVNETGGVGVGVDVDGGGVTLILGDSQVYQIIYSNVIYFPVMYVVPLLSMSYLNARLMRSLKEIRIKKQSLTGHKAKEDHITRCVVVIVICFILCQTPALVNQIFWAALDARGRACGRFHFYYTKLSDTLVVFNSSCNFVIYCLFGKSFRKIFLDALCMSSKPRIQNRTQTCLNDFGETDAAPLSRRCPDACETTTL